MVCLEHALEPFRAAVTRMVPEVEGECRIRDTNVTDYDSYRRRLKDMYAKKVNFCFIHIKLLQYECRSIS